LNSYSSDRVFFKRLIPCLKNTASPSKKGFPLLHPHVRKPGTHHVHPLISLVEQSFLSNFLCYRSSFLPVWSTWPIRAHLFCQVSTQWFPQLPLAEYCT